MEDNNIKEEKVKESNLLLNESEVIKREEKEDKKEKEEKSSSRRHSIHSIQKSRNNDSKILSNKSNKEEQQVIEDKQDKEDNNYNILSDNDNINKQNEKRESDIILPIEKNNNDKRR